MGLRGNYVSTQTTYESAIYARDSRCVTVDDGSMRQGVCFKHECLYWDVVQKQYNGIKITTSDATTSGQTPEDITCLRSDTLTWKQSASFSMRIKCPDIDIVCGFTSGPFACDRGEWNDELMQCICSVGYIGADCSTEDKNRLADEAALFAAVRTPTTNVVDGLCIEGSSLDALNGYYLNDGAFEGLPSYLSHTKAVYFSRYYHQWNIAQRKGDISMYAYCVQYLPLTGDIDIADCNKWTIWDPVNHGWMEDPFLSISHCTPTVAPTPNPTAVTAVPTTSPS